MAFGFHKADTHPREIGYAFHGAGRVNWAGGAPIAGSSRRINLRFAPTGADFDLHFTIKVVCI